MARNDTDTPFDDDIAAPPGERACPSGPAATASGRAPFHLTGLNDEALERVAAHVQQLGHAFWQSGARRAGKALLVTSAGAGYGKTHFIGQLFTTLAGEATVVALRPAPAPNLIWRHLLDAVVESLELGPAQAGSASLYRADARTTTEAVATARDENGLELFCHAVLGRSMALLLEGQQQVRAQDMERLRGPVNKIVRLQVNASWQRLLQKALGSRSQLRRLQRRLAARGVSTHAQLHSWLHLCHTLIAAPDPDLRDACLDWLRGQPIAEDCAEQIGIASRDRCPNGQSDEAHEAVAHQRVLDLSQLMALFQPLVVCIDHTDPCGGDEALAQSLGRLVAELVDEARHLQLVITANAPVWAQIEARWAPTYVARIRRPTLWLEGIDAEQAMQLAQYRLSLAAAGDDVSTRFLGDGDWIDGLADADGGRISPRVFLQACAARWRAGPVVELPPAEQLDTADAQGTGDRAPVDVPTGEPSDEVDLAAGEPSAEVDLTAGEPSAEVDLASGEPSSDIDLPSGEPSAEVEVDLGPDEPCREVDLASGEVSAQIDLAAGEPSSDIDLSSGEPSAEIDLSGGEASAEIDYTALEPLSERSTHETADAVDSSGPDGVEPPVVAEAEAEQAEETPDLAVSMMPVGWVDLPAGEPSVEVDLDPGDPDYLLELALTGAESIITGNTELHAAATADTHEAEDDLSIDEHFDELIREIANGVVVEEDAAREALGLAVTALARRLPATEVISDEEDAYSDAVWQRPDLRVGITLSIADTGQAWGQLARRASRRENAVQVCLRTSSQPAVPNARWRVAAPIIERAIDELYLRVEVLSEQQLGDVMAVVQLYREMRERYNRAELDTAADVLCRRLRWLWDLIVGEEVAVTAGDGGAEDRHGERRAGDGPGARAAAVAGPVSSAEAAERVETNEGTAGGAKASDHAEPADYAGPDASAEMAAADDAGDGAGDGAGDDDVTAGASAERSATATTPEPDTVAAPAASPEMPETPAVSSGPGNPITSPVANDDTATPPADDGAPPFDAVAHVTSSTRRLAATPTDDLAEMLRNALTELGIAGQVAGQTRAPQFVQFELSPTRGLWPAALLQVVGPKLERLAEAVQSPGPIRACTRGNYVLLEVPKAESERISWEDMAEDPSFFTQTSNLSFPIGIGPGRTVRYCDLNIAHQAHVLIAGQRGSGIRQLLRSILASLTARNSPRVLQLTLVDPEAAAFAELKGSTYLTHPVIDDVESTLKVLQETLTDIKVRRGQLKRDRHKRLADRHAAGRTEIPFRVVMIDEIAPFLLADDSVRDRFVKQVTQIARYGRRTGVHLVLATRSVSAEVLTEALLDALPLHVALRMGSVEDSTLLLNESGAERLSVTGEMLVDRGDGIERVMGAWFEETQDAPGSVQALRGA
jgi:DNA segregation ATPase FtsK/SpoIIIE-like protein